MKINQPSEIKSIQFLGSPFQGKKADLLSPAPSSNEISSKKRLISLISTKGKTPAQVAQEAMEAVQKYPKVSEESAESETTQTKRTLRILCRLLGIFSLLFLAASSIVQNVFLIFAGTVLGVCLFTLGSSEEL